MKKDTPTKTTGIIIVLSIIIAALSVYILFTNDLSDKPLAGRGKNITDENLIGGEFTLIDQNGKEFKSDMMKGKLSLVYFGFTSCPDICPTTLEKLGKVVATLDKYQIDVVPIFITIDPERDTPSSLKEYLSHFHPKLIGLTGDKESIKQVASAYKVSYAKSEDNNAANNYMMDHSSFLYLMGKDGKYMKLFYMSSPEDEIVEYIRVNGK